MQITIKVLKGEDCTLEVSSDSTIFEIKVQIEKILKIPAVNQKLLLLGRPLSDDQPVYSYPSIREGTKLNLVVMKKSAESLRDVIHRSFRKYYSEQQSEKLTNSFMLDFETKLKQLSLDDLELFADNLIHSASST